MPRITFIGQPAQGIPGGPLWEPGETRDLSEQEAAPYLRNANWTAAPDQAAPQAPPAVQPAAPQEG